MNRFPEVQHLIQFDMPNGEIIAFWPSSTREREAGAQHLRSAGASDYIVRSKDVPVATESGFEYEWRTISAQGRYLEGNR